MNLLQEICQSAESIVTICKQDRLVKSDKDSLLKLQGQIFTQIENLTECQICSCVSDLIVSITINQNSANLCRSCGIESLNNGQIKKGKRRRSPANGSKKASVCPPSSSEKKIMPQSKTKKSTD